MVAFVADHHPIASHEIENTLLARKVAFLEQPRDKRDADDAARQALSSADLTDDGALLLALAARSDRSASRVSAERIRACGSPMQRPAH